MRAAGREEKGISNGRAAYDNAANCLHRHPHRRARRVLRTNRLAYKPSALVPWADPYIAGLVRRLQSEVRFERARSVAASPHADLEPPSPVIDADWDAWDQPRWTTDGDAAE